MLFQSQVSRLQSHQPIVFKYLLDVLKVESNLHSGDHHTNIDFDHSCQSLQKYLQILKDSILKFDDSTNVSNISNQDLAKLLSSILKYTSRIMSKLISLANYEINHATLLYSSIEILHLMIKTVYRNAKSMNLARSVLIEDQTYTLVVYLHIAAILEASKVTTPLSNNNKISCNNEHLLTITLELYVIILKVLYHHHNTKHNNYESWEVDFNDKDSDILKLEYLKQYIILENKKFCEIIVGLVNSDDNNNINVPNDRLQKSFQGPFAAQIIQSLLIYMNSQYNLSSKQIISLSLKALIYSMQSFQRSTQQITTWRNVVPGVFSQLYILSQTGYKSGSEVLCNTIICMLEIVRMLTCDHLSENHSLFLYNTTTATSTTTLKPQCVLESDVVTVQLTKPQSQDTFKHFINAHSNAISTTLISATTSNYTTTSNDNSTSICPEGFSSIADYQQWRVSFLQRITSPLTHAIQTAFHICSTHPYKKVNMLIALSKLLYQSYQFLGHRCIADLILTLIGNISDSNAIVRLTARLIWSSFITTIKTQSINQFNYSFYNKLVTIMNENFINTLTNTYKIAQIHGCDALQLSAQLHILLGYGICVKDHLTQLVRITGNDISTILSKLFMYDINSAAVQMASILETRKYYNNDIIDDSNNHNNDKLVRYIESGYYRISWKYFHDAATISIACQLAVLLGSNGLFKNVQDLSKQTISQLKHKFHKFQVLCYRQTNDNVSITNNITNVRMIVDDIYNELLTILNNAVAIFNLFNYIWLGCGDFIPRSFDCESTIKQSFIESACVDKSITIESACVDKSITIESACVDKSITIQSTLCGWCHKQQDDGMQRCSRCKHATYCSKEHQKLHWTAHKLMCKLSNLKEAVDSKPQATSATTNNTYNDENVVIDKYNPYILLHTNTFCKAMEPYNKETAVSMNSIHHIRSNYSQISVDMYIEVIKMYIEMRSMQEQLLTEQSYSNDASTSEELQHSNKRSIHLVTSFLNKNVYFVAIATEGLANIAFVLGIHTFRAYLIECLYPLLELLVDSNIIVKQAAKCSLERIAMYLKYNSLTDLMRSNLDYIVDRICSQLRLSSRVRSSSGVTGLSGISVTVHLVIDYVFQLLGHIVAEQPQHHQQQQQQDGSQCWDEKKDCNLASTSSSTTGTKLEVKDQMVAPLHLLREVIYDAIENIDFFTATTTYKRFQLRAFLKVLHVLTCRAANPPGIETFLNLSTTTVTSNDHHLHIYLNEIMAKRIFPDYNDYMEKIKSTTNTTANVYDDSVNDIIDSLIAFDRNLNVLRDNEELRINNIDSDSNSLPEEEEHEEVVEDNVSNLITPSTQLLLDIIHRSCYFITLQDIQVQVTILETINAALVRLSVSNSSHYLPCIHSLWPTIMQRIRDIRIVLNKDPILLLQPNKHNESTIRDHSLLLNSSSSSVVISTSTSSLISMLSEKEKKDKAIIHTDDIINHSSDDGNQDHYRHQLQVLLPYLFDNISILAMSAKSFMTLKFKDDFLPELLLLLCVYQNKYLRTTTTLLSVSGSSTTNNNGNNSKKYSIHTKVKLSLLGMLLQIIHIKELESFMKINTTVIVWFLIQFLSTNESDEVHRSTEKVILAFFNLDSAAVLIMLQSIIYSHKVSTMNIAHEDIFISISDAEYIWNTFVELPSINFTYQHYYKEINNLNPNMTEIKINKARNFHLLKQYHLDNLLQQHIRHIINQFSIIV